MYLYVYMSVLKSLIVILSNYRSTCVLVNIVIFLGPSLMINVYIYIFIYS